MRIKVKPKKIFKTKLFQSEIKVYFSKVFIKLFKKYRLKPAKGGKVFEEKVRSGEIGGVDLPDMSYPMHILNGTIPSLKVLENKWLNKGLINEDNEDDDIKMLLKCLLIAFTFHDINKLHNEIDLKTSVEKYFEEDLKDLEIELNEEEKEIVKYLILATEERTRFVIPDDKLPTRRGLNRLIKDDLIEIIHLADSISIPIGNYNDLLKIWKKLKNYVDVNVFYFDEIPYEVLARFIVERLREDVDCYVISPRGFIYEGNLEINEDYLIKSFEEFLYRNIEKMVEVNRDKAQLDIFRFIDINEENISKLIEKIINNFGFEYFYRGISSDEEIRDALTKEFESFDDEEKKKFAILTFLYKLTGNESRKKEINKLKSKFNNKYFKTNDETFGLDRKIVEKINSSKDNALKKYLHLYIATKKGFDEKEILADLITLLNENYGGSERANLKEIINELLGYAYLNGKKIKDIKFGDIGSKKNMCSLCGRETKTVAIANLCFGFKPRGFTNRTVVSLSNTQKNICSICLTEITFRKLIFGKKENVQAVYIDAYDYFVPLMEENLTKYIESVGENLGNLMNDAKSFISAIYGFNVKKEEQLFPFLMGFVDISKQIEFIRFYKKILDFVYETGFKIYLTYPFNPDKAKRETIIFDYVPKSFKKLGWERVRIDEIEKIKNEFELLWKLGYALKGGSKSDNVIVSLFNDYADNPMAFYFYLFKLDYPHSFAERYNLNIINQRIGVEKMNIIEKLADIASDIEWAKGSASSKTSMIRESLEVLKTGVKRGYGDKEVKSMMAGMLYRKYPYPSKKEKIEEFCEVVYDELFKKLWNGKIPSKKELRYWIYAFAFHYDAKSREKRTAKINQEETQ
jgi:CRISPR-associated protein Csc3